MRVLALATQGGVVEWTPSGVRHLEPNGWGATGWAGLAWSRDGTLAVARGDERRAIRGRSARRLVGLLPPNNWTDHQTGRVMVLSHGKLLEVTTIGYSSSFLSDRFAAFYGHYDWPPFLAVRP